MSKSFGVFKMLLLAKTTNLNLLCYFNYIEKRKVYIIYNCYPHLISIKASKIFSNIDNKGINRKYDQYIFIHLL